MTDTPPLSRTRPKRFLVWWVAVSSVVALGAFVVGGLTLSPWEGAVANSNADPAVTAKVGTQEFVVPVATATGTASAGATTTVVPVASAAGRTVVTAVPAPAGSVLQPGHVLAEVSGRPLIALNLPFEMYRDLAPGDSGPDVRALQQALVDAGVSTGLIDGNFGPRTSAAVRALYTQNSVTAPQPSAEKAAALDEAIKALAEASKPTTAEPKTTNSGSGGALAGFGTDARAGPDGNIGAENEDGTGGDVDPGGDDRAAADAAAAKAAADEAAAAAAAKQAKDAELADLQRVVDEARLAADTPLPMAEIITIPAGGVEIVSVAAVGTSLAGDATALATLRQGSLSVTARVGVKDAATFALGALVTVTPSTGGQGVEGTIVAVSEFQGADDTSDLPGFDVTVTFTPETIGLADGSTVVVRPAGSGESLSGLAVPLVAIRNDGAQAYVLILEGETTRKVEVVVDMTANGFALVNSDGLHDGDTVLISGTP